MSKNPQAPKDKRSFCFFAQTLVSEDLELGLNNGPEICGFW